MAGRDFPSFCLVDSNIFLRAFVRSDEQMWKESTNVLETIAKRRFAAYIPALVVIEVQFVLDSFYQFEKHRVVEAIKSMLALPALELFDDLSLPLAIEMFSSHSVKFTDCLLASSRRVQEGKAAVLSYDRDFDKLGIKRLQPRDLLKLLSAK